MRQKSNHSVISGFLCFSCCCLLLTVGALCNQQTISQQENRMLQQKPVFTIMDYLSGDYFRQWEAYINDHIPAREQFLDGAKSFTQMLTYHGYGKMPQIVETTADVGVQQKEEELEHIVAQPKQELLVLDDGVFELYEYQDSSCEAYATAVNAYAQWLPEEISFYHMLVPMPIAFAQEDYQQLSDNQRQAIASVYNRLDERIYTIDVYSVLEQHQQEAIYFRTDHHWTMLGAYYGAQAMAQASGVNLLPLDAYHVYSMDHYWGQLASNHLTPQLKEHPEELVYYLRPGHNALCTIYFYQEGQTKCFQAPMVNIDFNHGQASYGIFINGDYPYTVVEGEADNGRVLAVVKDSYGNAMIPWLTVGYEKIIAIDPRTCEENLGQLLQQYNVTDFLLLDYVKVTSMPSYAQQLQALLEN